MMTRTSRSAPLIRPWVVTLLIFCACGSASAKTLRGDVVTMKNGDRFTGEVKRLQSGVLYIETDYAANNLAVEWTQVQNVKSTATYLITLSNGTHVTGKLERLPGTDENGADVTILNETQSMRLPPADVIDIASHKPSFWRQLQGSIDAGTSFTSGNSQVTANTDLTATYTTPNWATSAGLSTSFNDQSGGAKTNRNDATFGGQYFLGRNAYVGGLLDFLHSSQQDLDLRTTVGGGYGRFFKRTGTTSFRWLGGVAYTRESFSTVTNPADSNAEGLLGVDYDSFRFKIGEIHLQAMVFPGLTDYGRIRATTNNSLVIKLTNNFHFTFTFWDNYDSRPPTSAKNNELGLSSAIGWAF
jgi:putative salt-induced outer membrane protein YdiY